MPTRRPLHPAGSGWTVEVTPEHADANTTHPCAITASSNTTRLTPTGLAAAIAALSPYLTAVTFAALQRLGPFQAFSVGPSRIVMPVLGKDADAQASALVTMLSTVPASGPPNVA